MKSGILTPVLKKGKDKNIPGAMNLVSLVP
jgi:hypothetical protein